MEPRNRFQEMNSASLCSMAGGYDNPIPTWLIVPIHCSKILALKPNSETYNFVEIFGLESSQTWGFNGYNVYITNQFQTTFAQRGGGGVKSVRRGDCEWQGGTLKTFVSITSKNSASGLFCFHWHWLQPPPPPNSLDSEHYPSLSFSFFCLCGS